MIDRELLVLFGVPTMFLVAGLFAYGLARLDVYRHQRASKAAKDEGAGRDARA
jgi:hypothetical protein